jgi:hypothetical protein
MPSCRQSLRLRWHQAEHRIGMVRSHYVSPVLARPRPLELERSRKGPGGWSNGKGDLSAGCDRRLGVRRYTNQADAGLAHFYGHIR